MQEKECNRKDTIKDYESLFPSINERPDYKGWSNGVQGWHIHNATPGLYTLDIEHIPDELVLEHNNPDNQITIASEYRNRLCFHNCPFCFNEDNLVYSDKQRDLEGRVLFDKLGNTIPNKMMTLEDTLNVIDQAIKIAKNEGHCFESVKFLGPGELLMNPKLFEIIEAYQQRGIKLNIFTKGALLGENSLAKRYHGLSSRELTDKLASYENVGLLMSFQSFDEELQNKLVTSISETGEIKGIRNYTTIRNKALKNRFSSQFYQNERTNRICIVNAPIVPENIDESFEIYRFFTARRTPVVMTPSMLSGKGCGEYKREKEIIKVDEWHNKLVELYAQIYAYNVKEGIQTESQIREEGIASYVGAEPCNQVATGLYIRANGIVQMCPGRFDRETIFGNVQFVPLEKIWESSPNKRIGLKNPHKLINNRCPAKDGRAFPKDFYERVMKRYLELIKEKV